MKTNRVQPDAKGRIALGELAKGVSGFNIYQEASGKIILVPHVEIPAHEKWLFDNKIALKKIIKGLEDSKKGHVSKRENYAQFLKHKEKS